MWSDKCDEAVPKTCDHKNKPIEVVQKNISMFKKQTKKTYQVYQDKNDILKNICNCSLYWRKKETVGNTKKALN